MVQNDISFAEQQLFKDKGTWDAISKVSQILNHANPKEKLNSIMNKGKITMLSKQEIIDELHDLISENITLINERQLGKK